MNTALASSALGLLLTGVVVVGAVHEEQLNDPLPTNFVLFIAAVCGDTIDTEVGELRRTVAVGQIASAKISVDEARRRELFRLASATRLFDYPARYNPPFEGGFAVPYPQYTIRVVAGERRHEIRWEAMRIATPDAERLSRFVRAVYDMFRTEPTVQALPPGLPCM